MNFVCQGALLGALAYEIRFGEWEREGERERGGQASRKPASTNTARTWSASSAFTSTLHCFG